MKQLAKHLKALVGAGECSILIEGDKMTSQEPGRDPVIHNKLPGELKSLKFLLQSMFSAEFEKLEIQVKEGGSFAYALTYIDNKGERVEKIEKVENNQKAAS